MKRYWTLAVVLAILAAGFVAAPPSQAAGSGPSTQVPIAHTGSTTLGALAAGATGDGSGLEFRADPEIDAQMPRWSRSPARIPADHVPRVKGSSFAGSNPGLAGFDGLTHADQRLAGTGAYANSQWNLEPPDQGMCVGGSYVLEAINLAVRVRSTSGAVLTAAVPLNQFFQLSPALVRGAAITYGDFTSDPKCYFDPDLQRWFLTALQADVDPATGAFTGPTSLLLAVSQSSDPTAGWNLFRIDSTNDGTNGTPSHTGCPCLGDQPLIGADAYGFYITTNEFTMPDFAGFNGAQVYAMSKAALAAGSLPAVVLINAAALAAPDGGIWYSLQPATTPPGGQYEGAAGGTEYMLSALQFVAKSMDNRIAVWALTNTGSLATATPQLSLSFAILDSEVYGMPPAAEQKDGPRPFAEQWESELYGIKTPPYDPLQLLDAGDDRMNQVVYAAGNLWSGLSTAIMTENGPARAGIAYFIVHPSVAASGAVSASMTKQGYVAVDGAYVMYPSIGVNASGQGAMVFALSGKSYYPSAAYVTMDAAQGAGPIHIAAAGAGPSDGYGGYVKFGGTFVTRWGDYSAAVADATGKIWMAVEYIPNLPRTVLENWGTYIASLAP